MAGKVKRSITVTLHAFKGIETKIITCNESSNLGGTWLNAAAVGSCYKPRPSVPWVAVNYVICANLIVLD